MPKLYRKKGIIEAERWQPGIDMVGVTINELDAANGSPRTGDMVATDPTNPKDRWLIAEAYFKRNYEAF